MRFPTLSVSIFALSIALTCVSTWLSSTYCAFGFGGFQCNGWVGEIAGLLFGWSMLAVVVIPLSFVIAAWRIVLWRRRTRGARDGL